MAKSRFEYVRNFELPDPLLPETFIVVRIDGRGFHKWVKSSPELISSTVWPQVIWARA
jgi:tRNA(His) guanylyltransferase